MGRYELVGFNEHLKGKIIKTKTGNKLTILEADKFTTLFNNSADLTNYLYKKGYLNDLKIVDYALLYKYNKSNRYIECLYSQDRKLVEINNPNNIYFKQLITYLLNNVNTTLPELAHNHFYINDYIYNKLLEYRILLRVGSVKELNKIFRDIEKELSKEYLQIRKLYIVINMYKRKKNIKEIKSKKVIGESNDPYIEYLITKANLGDSNAYEELKNMDLEKTLNLIL